MRIQEMISIVLPIYNGQEYIQQCIESILKQTYTDWELIVSDDHSWDRTIEIIKSYKDPRIKIIQNNAQRGIFQNMNNAIRHASGDYIQLFNQDDVMLSTMLERQISLLYKYPDAGMVFCKKYNINEAGEAIEVPSSSATTHFHSVLPELITPQEGYQYFVAFGCIPGNLSPVMITREAWNKAGAFNENFHYAGDFEYWVRISETFSISFNNQYLCEVRTHMARASNVLGKKDLRITSQLFTINRSLLKRYRDIHQREKATSYLQRTVGIYQLHSLIRFLLAGKIREVREIRSQFHGIFSIRKLWWKYLRYQLSKKRYTDYPIF